jgi:hypothetical protein
VESVRRRYTEEVARKMSHVHGQCGDCDAVHSVGTRRKHI